MLEQLEAELAPESERQADSRVESNTPLTISTQVVPCGTPPLRSLFPVVGDALLHFQLIGELGAGAFSRVFLASQQDLVGRLVALKVSECADGEPQRLARLQHTNIVPIYSVHHYFQYQVVCMPYVGAHTLASVLKHQGVRPQTTGRQLVDTLLNKPPSARTTPDRADRPSAPLGVGPVEPLSPNLELLNRLSHVDAVLWIASRLADGLAHAHERGIFHCDLKPQNVLLSDDGQPMLLDFNVALDARSSPGTQRHFGGTVPYMSPEHLAAVIENHLCREAQLNNGSVTAIHGRGCSSSVTASIDGRSDLYSLGVILYHLLTGRDPHDLPASRLPDTPSDLLQVRGRPPVRPSRWNRSITPAVDAIVLKLLAPNRDERYACAADLREDLERHLADQPLLHAPNTSLSERAGKWRRRNPRLAAALAVGLAALALLVAPATAVAVFQDRIATRRQEVQLAEAQVRRTAALERARTAQILLSTQNGDRALLEEGFALGRAVLNEYEVGRDPSWSAQPRFALLSGAQQRELRRELGELALLLARGELLRSTPDDAAALGSALEWNRLAEVTYTTDDRPRWLARQRAELLSKAPGAAPALPEGRATEFDAYHDGLLEAVRGRYGEALAQLVPFSDRHPEHFMAWFVRGVCHDGVGQLAEAAAAYTVCAAIRPDMPWPYYNRGLVSLQHKRHESAERDFTDALRLRGDWTAALINRAIARQGRRDFAGAEQDLTAALERPDAPTRVYFLRSLFRREAGNAPGAEQDAAEGFKRTPTDSVSYVTRGVWHLGRDNARALADFDEALRLNPRSRDALQNKAVLLADYQNKPAEAAAVMDQLLEMYPAHIDARAGRGVYLARAGDGKRARQDAQTCLRDEPNAFRYYQMAGLYAQLARHESDGQARREAFRLLALAVRSGFSDLDLMKKDSDIDPVRDSEEYRSLLTHASALLRQ